MQRSFLQTKSWADFRQDLGWQIYNIDDIWVLGKNLPLGKNFLYVPEVMWGWDYCSSLSRTISNVTSRLADARSKNNFEIFLSNIQKIAKNNNTIFIRLEILNKYDAKIVDILKENGFIKSFEEVQPEWRQIINLEKSEEEILGQMKQKGRYNIRIAQKHGVSVEKSDPSTTLGVNDFYEIFQKTAKRDGFEIRPKEYFEKLMQYLGSEGIAELWLAKYNGKAVAAIIATFYDGVASYLYGASSNENRQVMAPYLLHWRVMQRAKENGCKEYDLLAIEPFRNQQSANSYEENINSYRPAESGERKAESHKYSGITRFKEQFGGEKIQIVGSWDMVYKPVQYKIFKIVEKIRRK